MGYAEATPIQLRAIPAILNGRDVMGSAQTGTGKTAAFALPLLTCLQSHGAIRALVLEPTRELAAQVRDILRQLLGRRPAFNMALLIGGESMGKQFAQLKGRPRIIVGTPGVVRIISCLIFGAAFVVESTQTRAGSCKYLCDNFKMFAGTVAENMRVWRWFGKYSAIRSN